MSEDVKEVIVAPRLAVRDRMPADWQERIARAPGIEVVGRSVSRMQLRATDKALKEAISEFGDMLQCETTLPRNFAGDC